MFGKKARQRRADRRDERHLRRADKKAARRNSRMDRATARQESRNAATSMRQETKQSMVSAGLDPNSWVKDVAGGVVGLANAASSYGQAAKMSGMDFAGMSPEAVEAFKSKQASPPPTDSDSILPIAAAAAGAYFLLKK